MDLDPFVPIGIGAQTVRFLDVFLLHCLLSESPPDTSQEIAELARNQHRTAARGRESGLRLERRGKEVLLIEWAAQVLEECAPIAAALDAVHGGVSYRDALLATVAALHEPDTLPSARVLDVMANHYDRSYIRFARTQSAQVKDTLLRLPFPAEEQARFMALAQESIEQQKNIEAADTMPFEIYRQAYLATERLRVPAQSG